MEINKTTFKDVLTGVLDTFTSVLNKSRKGAIDIEDTIKSKKVTEPELGDHVILKDSSVFDRVATVFDNIHTYEVCVCVPLEECDANMPRYADKAKTRCWKLVNNNIDASYYERAKELYFTHSDRPLSDFRSIFETKIQKEERLKKEKKEKKEN